MPRIKKLTDYTYSPTNPASEDAIRAQIDDAIQEVYDASSRNDATVNLTGVQTIEDVKTFTDGIKVPVASAVDNPIRKDTFETHKTSADHDGRYYTESEVNALLLANQQGNHIGSWQGVVSPAYSEPGIAGVVEGHTEKLEDIIKQQISLIPETLKKLQSGQDVLIHVVGDSITQGVGGSDTTCYVGVFASLIATLYPNSTVIRYDGDGEAVVQNAPILSFPATTIQTGTNGQTIHIVRNGVGGDTVLMLGRRIDNFTTVFQGKKPDLIIVNVGVNDSLTNEAVRYVPASRFKWQLDGLIRNIKNRTGSEIALMTPPSTYTTALSDYAKAIQDVSRMNGMQTIESYELWLNHYVDGASFSGQGDWGIDTWHPSVLGHSKIAEILYNTLFVDNQKVLTLQDNKKTYWYDDLMFVYGGSWSNNVVDNLSDGLNTYTEKAGSLGETITFSIYANEIAILTRPNQVGGKFTYAIDGGNAIEVDTAVLHPTSTANVTDTNSASMSAEKIFIATGLDNNLHTVVLTVTQNFVLFSGIEIVTNDSSKNPKPTKVINNGTISITGTGTTFKAGLLTFPVAHKTIPTLVATTNDILYVVSTVPVGTTSANIFISRKDGATFTATVSVYYISIDA